MTGAIGADLAGRTCLVTGASAGIGKEVARGLARLRARVILACRNRDKGEAVRREIAESASNPDVDLSIVDLAVQRSIRDFAGRLLARGEPLAVLVNNAGVWLERREETPDGIERVWATNMLGYFLLTDLLRPLLEKSAAARVVNVASELAHDLDIGDVEFRRRRFSGVTAYAQSKQANRMWSWALDRRMSGSGVTVNAAHPGGVATEIFKKGGGLLSRAVDLYARASFKTPAEGADTILWLAASPEVQGQTGRFWADRRERACRFRGTAGEDALWDLCARMTAAAKG